MAYSLAHESRHRHLPWHQPRARHGDRPGALRRQATHGLAPGHRPVGPGPGGDPRRLQLRRLPALRRHGRALPGDGRGARACRTRRLRTGRVQRLPDPHRGRIAARRPAAQCHAALPGAGLLPPGGACRHHLHQPVPTRRNLPRGDGAWRRQLLRRRRHAGPAGGRQPGRLPLRHQNRRDHARKPTATAAPATSPASSRPTCACSASCRTRRTWSIR